ncbi:MAG: cyclic nucleotide-binding domain-containing protein [Steroidobacteraceae bacterium]
MAEGRPVSVQLLKTFAPLEGMKRDNLRAIANKVQVRPIPAGRLFFSEGDRDPRTIWLVSGAVELREGQRTVATIRAGSPEARNPLAPGLPRRFTARTTEDSEYVSIDNELLDVIMTWDQTGSYEVSELQSQVAGAAESHDWMTTLLSTRAFHKIPPANIQAIFLRMQRVDTRVGEVVIKQGDEGDFFYAIVSGKCSVTRETPLNKEGLRLAELSAGDTFGEEALISEAKRNATVTMLTDGTLMRLDKQDFRQLLNDPLLKWVNSQQAREIVARGGKWLDVRLPSEFQSLRIEEAINLPLYFMRLKLSTLDASIPYVVYCDTGRRSSAGAFIMVERGLEAYVLQGGLSSGDLPLRGNP